MYSFNLNSLHIFRLEFATSKPEKCEIQIPLYHRFVVFPTRQFDFKIFSIVFDKAFPVRIYYI